MGDPRKQRKKYKGPNHPWQRKRIEEERIIKKEYGLKNKKEIWKASSILRRSNIQAKKLISEKNKGNPQAEIEEKQLIGRLYKLGLLNEDAKLDDVLSLELKDILNRRLQTFVYKKGLCLTPKQARQFIVHGCIFVNGRKISVPSYLVGREEELTITFNPNSSLASDEHPERAKKLEIKAAAEKKKKAEEASKEEVLDIKEEELEKIEKEIGGVTVE